MLCFILSGEDFVGDPIPFRINTENPFQLCEMEIEPLLLNDGRFERQIQGFFLLIVVNTTTTNPLAVQFSQNPALFQILDNDDSKYNTVKQCV